MGEKKHMAHQCTCTVEPRCLEVPGSYNPSSSHPNFEASESGFLNVCIEIYVVMKIANMRSHNTILYIVYVFYADKIQTKKYCLLFICINSLYFYIH